MAIGGFRTKLAPVALIAIQTAFGEQIGSVEFFGYQGLDVNQLRRDLPVTEGDSYSDTTKELIRQWLTGALGKAPTDVAAVCCDEKGGRMIFVGLPGESMKTFAYRDAPQGNERLPAAVMDLYRDLDHAIQAAVRQGGDAAREDDSQGFALAMDPAARTLQLRVRQWAVAHETELFRVLESSSLVDDRRVAADALGYARRSKRQIRALVRAARDPDDDVRNNATRALSVMVSSNPKVAHQIDPGTFIEMLNSGIWTDRNKAAGLLMYMSASRSRELLSHIRAQALESLIEMASWRQTGHAFFSRMILGRVVGIPEKQLQEWAWKGNAQAIIEAARSR